MCRFGSRQTQTVTAMLLRWQQTQMVGVLDGSQSTREMSGLGVRRGNGWSSLGMMGEDTNDILDPEYNDNAD